MILSGIDLEPAKDGSFGFIALVDNQDKCRFIEPGKKDIRGSVRKYTTLILEMPKIDIDLTCE